MNAVQCRAAIEDVAHNSSYATTAAGAPWQSMACTRTTSRCTTSSTSRRSSRYARRVVYATLQNAHRWICQMYDATNESCGLRYCWSQMLCLQAKCSNAGQAHRHICNALLVNCLCRSASQWASIFMLATRSTCARCWRRSASSTRLPASLSSWQPRKRRARNWAPWAAATTSWR